MGFPGGSVAKNLPAIAGDPRVSKTPWRKEWQPAPVFLPGESRGQRSLVGRSLWGHKESGRTQRLRKNHKGKGTWGRRWVCTQKETPVTEK